MTQAFTSPTGLLRAAAGGIKRLLGLATPAPPETDAPPDAPPAPPAEKKAAKEAPAASPDPYAAAIADMRSAAKWLLAAFATVGALFGAGVQITGVGDLTGQDGTRSIAAGIGYVAVVIGIVAAIAATSRVLRRDIVNLHDVLTKKHLADVKANTSVAEPFPSVDRLEQEFQRLLGLIGPAEQHLRDAALARDRLPDLGPTPSASAKRTKDAADLAVRQAQAQVDAHGSAYALAAQARRRTLGSAAVADVRHRFQQAIGVVCASAVATACGLLAFVWGANPPDPGKLATPPVLPQTPTAVTFLLTDQGRARYASTLGANCPVAQPLDGIAMSVSGQEYRVASKQTAQCKSGWLVLGPALARVSPAAQQDPAAAATKTPSGATTASATTSPTTTSAK